MTLRALCVFAVFGAFSVAAGCRSQTARATSKRSTGADVAAAKPTADQAVAADPCATRLHDIAGAMLLYYSLNKQLPEKLSDLASLADFDQPLEFKCPVSNEPYTYNPAGLVSRGRGKRIVVYDPQPSHRGARWCVLMAESTPARPTLALEVLLIEEGLFRTYQP